MGNNKESCDEIILGIREKITRFVLSKVDQELNKLQELSVNCQQQQIFVFYHWCFQLLQITYGQGKQVEY
jgi:hypothetical protein